MSNVQATLLGQVAGHTPDDFIFALHDTSTTQGFESAHIDGQRGAVSGRALFASTTAPAVAARYKDLI